MTEPRYTGRAVAQLAMLGEYIAEHNPAAALKVRTRILNAVNNLGEFPMRGRPGIVEGTRELVVPGLPYVCVYRIDDGVPVVLGIYHQAQRRPGAE